MEVALRMKMFGTKKTPFFRIVAICKPKARGGKILEEIGNYDPKKKGEQVTIKKDRVDYWIKNGARPSETVKSIIKKYCK